MAKNKKDVNCFNCEGNSKETEDGYLWCSVKNIIVGKRDKCNVYQEKTI